MNDIRRAALGDIGAGLIGALGLVLLRLGRRLWIAVDDNSEVW